VHNPKAGCQPVDEKLERMSLDFFRAKLGVSERHDRTEINIVVESCAREHDALQMGNREADRNAFLLRLEHPTCGRAVPIDVVINAPVISRRHIRHRIENISDLADNPRVDNRIDGVPVVLRQPMISLESRPFARGSAVFKASSVDVMLT